MLVDIKAQLRVGQDHLASRDPKIAKLIKKYGDCLIVPHTDYYSELVSSIVGQQLSVNAAAAIWQRVLAMSGGNPPTPKQLINASNEDLRAAGLSRPKISYVKDLARHIEDERLDMANIATLPNNEIITQLTAVKGIGEWSAHMFMLFGLGRLDILPIGDLGIRKAVMQIYELDHMPGREETTVIANVNNWNPYESVASWYLWKSLENTGIRIKKDT